MACISERPELRPRPVAQPHNQLQSASSRSCSRAKPLGVKRFVCVSSSSVYGVSGRLRRSRRSDPLVPLTGLQQIQGALRADPLPPPVTGLRLRDYPPGERSAAYSPRHAFRSDGEHSHQPRGQPRCHHRVRRGSAAARISTSTMFASFTSNCWPCRQRKSRAKPSTRAIRTRPWTRLADIAKQIVEEEFPGKKPVRIEHTTTNDPRSLPHHLAQDRQRNSAGIRKRNIGGRRAGSLPRFQDERNSRGDTLKDESFINVKTG